MLSIARAINQSALRNAGLLNSARTVSIKVVPAPTSSETFVERNDRLGRAVSPHLSIYKIQLTAFLSISHRMTGMLLAGYTTALGVGALVSPVDFSHYITMVEGLELSDAALTALKFTLAFPFAYHASNGIRHLVWDSAKCLNISEVYTTGYAMVASSILLAGILAIL